MKLQTSKVNRSLPVLAALTASLAFGGCGDEVSDPLSAPGSVRLRVSANVLLSTTTLIIEVTAADIATRLAFDLPIEHRVASGSITIPAGSNRTFTLRAYDFNDIETHRGFLTVDIHEGTTPIIISITLDPLASDGSASIIVSIGSLVLSITPSFTTLAVGDVVQLTAILTDADGNTVDGKVRWGTLDATKATVDKKGLVTTLDVGDVQIAALAEGVTVLAELEILTLEGLVESLIGDAFQIWWSGTQGPVPSMALSATADEFSLSWGNFAIRQLSSEPRVAWPNDPTLGISEFNDVPWTQMYTALSAIHEGMRRLDEVLANGDPDGIAPRATAFAKFVQGLSHGWLALMFDQAFILDETVDLEDDDLVLQPHPVVWAAARGYFQEAITIASGAGFALPSTWINGQALTSSELVQLIHSQLARWVPQVARTPAERDAVDWAAVISHVDQGIQQDFMIDGDGGFDSAWFHAMQFYGFQTNNDTWSRADYKTIGWTDQGGGFASWLAAPVADRDEFLLDVPDHRITDFGRPTEAGLDFIHGGPSAFPVNRGTYHFSFYQGSRYEAYPLAGGFGPITYMTVTEMQLTKAEGMLRVSGPSQAVVDIINATGIRGHLPFASATEAQADLMDKLIYERRIENYGVCSGCAFFDRRGLGPLAPTGPNFHQGPVEGTPLHFPVPGRVLAELGLPNYTFGGVGNELAPPAAATISRAVPARHVYAFSADPGMSVMDKLRYLRESKLDERRRALRRQ